MDVGGRTRRRVMSKGWEGGRLERRECIEGHREAEEGREIVDGWERVGQGREDREEGILEDEAMRERSDHLSTPPSTTTALL